MNLLPKNAKIEGNIFFENKNLLDQEETELQKIRGNKVSYIFQEPMTSLNPLQTIQHQIKESIILHQKLNKNEASKIDLDKDKEGISTTVNITLHDFT